MRFNSVGQTAPPSQVPATNNNIAQSPATAQPPAQTVPPAINTNQPLNSGTNDNTAGPTAQPTEQQTPTVRPIATRQTQQLHTPEPTTGTEATQKQQAHDNTRQTPAQTTPPADLIRQSLKSNAESNAVVQDSILNSAVNLITATDTQTASTATPTNSPAPEIDTLFNLNVEPDCGKECLKIQLIVYLPYEITKVNIQVNLSGANFHWLFFFSERCFRLCSRCPFLYG